MDELTDDLIENNSTSIIQPDTQQPHNDTTGTKRSDGKTTSGGSSGYARRVLPRRILLHLPIRCSDTRPNLRSIIRRICAKGYIVDIDYKPGRLSRDDNGYFKVFLGNRRTVYMLTIIEDTPAEQAWRPRTFERNQRGEY
jgi:hypothetical protein